MTPTRRITILGWLRATLAAASLAAIVLVVTGLMAGADTHSSHGWTYDTATGVVSATADAWHKPSAKGPIEVTLWRRDTHDGTQTRLTRTTIPNLVPVTITLGVIPPQACGGQWDVRASDGTWLAGKQWQLPSCGGPTSTTTTTSPPTTTTTSTSSTTTSPTTEPTTTTTTTEPTSSTTTQPTTSTTTPPTTTTTTEPTWTTTAPPTTTQPPTTTSPPTTSTSSTATSTSSGPTATSSTSGSGTSTQPQRPPTTPASNTPLPSTGGNAWTGPGALLGALALALGAVLVASGRKTGKYRR